MTPTLAQLASTAAMRLHSSESLEGQDPRNGPLQQDILAALRETPEGLSAGELAEKLCVSQQNADCSLRGLLRRGAIARRKGKRQATHRKQVKKVWVYRTKGC